MYDKHPVKKRLSDMAVGDIERVYLSEISFTYLWNIIGVLRKEKGMKFTTRRTRRADSEFVSVIRLS
jgi:hypothetical protein